MRGHVQEPRGKSLRRIAAVVGTTTDWLLSGTGKAPTARTIRAALEAARARTDAERAA